MKDIKKNIIAIVSVIILMVAVILSNPVVRVNNNNIKNSILSIKEKNIIINDVISFKWDKLYSFTPYTSKETIEKTIGTKSNLITESVNDDMVQYIFVKDNKVVASICDSYSELGYRIEIDSVINAKDKVEFKVSKKDGIIILKEK